MLEALLSAIMLLALLYLEVNIYSLVKDYSEHTLYKHTS